jgi:NADPH-dependent 2,4-dienoyl-CoA reductase/sulfur reductase-like enzyme
METQVNDYSFDADGNVSEVHLSNGKSIKADLVIAGIGAKPNTNWLHNSGLSVENDGGITCDSSLRSITD